MFYRRKFYVVNNEFLPKFNALFNEINLPSQIKHGARLIGRWMVPIDKTTSEIFAIWEYDSYEAYKGIETCVRTDTAHLERINKWYEENGGRAYINKECILQSKNEQLHSTVSSHDLTENSVQFWLRSNTLLDAFYNVARQLNEKLNIVPLLYGSLGLQCITSVDLGANDIDILIPYDFISIRWDELIVVMHDNGFSLVDKNEHEFANGQIKIGFSYIEELESFVGIKQDDLVDKKHNQIKYKVLSLDQYECVYQKSILDGYRIHTRHKKDQQKLDLIARLKNDNTN